MPTPLIYRHDAADPFTLVAPDRRHTEVEVFYAVDRGPTGAADPYKAYGTARGESLRLGRATVRMGAENHDWATLVDETRRNTRPWLRVTHVEEFGELWTTAATPGGGEGEGNGSATGDPAGEALRGPARRFAAEINARLAASHTRDIVLHVPGFNTTFVDPIDRMACLAHFLSRDPVCIAYSWPSWPTALEYDKQLVRARASVRNLRQLLLFLAAETDVEHIHVIAFSNGAQIATDALVQIRLANPGLGRDELRARLKIGHVVYAAADEDLIHFRGALLDRIDEAAESVLVYTSRRDTGLDLSRAVASNSPRVGQAREIFPDGPQRVTLVDVAHAQARSREDDIWAHSYWYLNPWVSSDLILLLRHDLPPERRGLVPGKDGPWTFPDDYPARAAAIARDALAP